MSNAEPMPRTTRWQRFIPLLVVMILAIPLYLGLGKDTKYVPSPFIGKTMPKLDGTPLLLETQAANQPALFAAGGLQGKPYIVNIWASWCPECPREHPVFNKYRQEPNAVTLVGLAYRDKPELARAWLQQFGNPYHHVLNDADGRLGIELGVTGAPETYFVDANGVVRYKHIGSVTEALLKAKVAEIAQ
jgi:cytochrome c biogenesis protein CcmG, thiol:disulfide interchange protein DsbE